MAKSLRILCLSLVAIISSVSFGIEYTSAVKVPTGNDIDLVAVLGTESVSQYEDLAKAIAAAKEVAAGEWTDFMAYQLEALNKLIEEAEQMYEEASANDDEVVTMIAALEEASAHVELDNIYILFEVYFEKIDEIKVGNEPGQCTQTQKNKAEELLDLVACALADAEEGKISAIEAKTLCLNYFDRIDWIIANPIEYSEFPIFLHGSDKVLPGQSGAGAGRSPWPVLEGAYDYNMPAGEDLNGVAHNGYNNLIEYKSPLFRFREPLTSVRFYIRAVGDPGEVDKNGNPHICISGFAMYDENGDIINLTTENVTSNATEREGQGIPGMLDYNPNTFFHSLWRTGTLENHYIEVTLPEGQYSAFSFKMISYQNTRSRVFPRELEIINVEDDDITSYTLTYMVDGEVYHTESLPYGASITAPASPTKDGYTFTGWKGLPETMPAQNIVVTGSFTQDIVGSIYPFKITTNPSAPELYAIKSGRGDAYWWTLDESDGSLVLKAYESAPTQHWYFMEVTEGETTYLQLFPYVGEGKAMSYNDANEGNSKVFAKELGAEGYDSRWIFDANGGSAPYGLKASYNSVWLCNYGGAGFKYGFSHMGPAYHAGSAMYLEPVSEHATITYMVDGEVYHTVSLPYGISITAPEPPKKAGYSFVGWEGLPETMPSENITVTAKFVKNNSVDIPAKDGEWLFDNPNNLYLCTEGSIDLIPYKVGANKTAPTTWGEDEDTGIEKTAEGIYMPKSTCLFMNLNEADKVRNYTLIYDLRLKDVTNYTGLLQTDLNNNSDSRLFITKGKFGVNAGGLGYGGEVIANQWHRVAIVVEDGFISTYIDGSHVGTSQNTNNDFWCLDKEGVFLFLDNDRESTDVEIAGVHFWKQVLSEVQIAVLGGEENMNDSKEYSLNFSKSANVVRTDRLLQSIAVSDDSGDVKTITVDVTKPYVSKVYDEGSTLICKVGVPLTVTFDCQGSGLNSYVYIDLEDDKQFSFNEGQTDQSGTDVMAYSFYSGSFDDDSEGVNSAGDVLTGDSRYTMICPTFNAPTEAGVYRIRFKTDWNSIDAGGQLAADGTSTGTNGFLANGGTIVDATLRVLGDFTVTYMVDGKVYHTEKVGYKDLISLPEPPTKEGYTFKEWDGIPETMPGNDIIVTGVFTANNYQITYMLDGEVYYTDSVACGEKIPTVTPTREGYTFNGWEGLPETMQANDLVVEGSFSVNNYTITYKVDGESYKTTSYAYSDTIVVEDIPQREGYTFSGWSEIPETMPANHITVSGTFSINSYKITYMLDGEVFYTDSIVYNTNIPDIKDPTKEGYTFDGWVELPQTMPSNDLVVEGSFTVNSYTITYMLDGKVYKTVTYNYGDTIVPEESPSTTGYVFSGWLGLPETMPAEDLIIVGVLAALDGNYTDDQGVQYTLEDNKEGYAVSGIEKNPSSEIVIPSVINDLPVTSIDERAFIAVENVQSVVIPSNITAVGKNAFYGCKDLLLVEWNTTAPVRADCFDKAENHGNMLVFVNDADTEVSYKGNVIVEGVAEQITISNDMAFRSRQQFTARNITFTKNFNKKTKIGTSGGWEAMVLPFDVQHVVSETRGELKPFGEADFDTSLPYWLGELQADGTFAATQRIVANKPFIMQLPNSDEYEDRYNVEGTITFSAEEVTVHATVGAEQEQGEGYVLLGSYEGTESDNYIYALNDEEYTVGGDTYMPGGVFVAGSRDIRPFEAYIYSASANRAPYLRIGGCDTGMEDLVADKDEVWHTLQGIRLSGRPTERGVYIKNGKKVMVK